ncbi:hypothetical protein BDR07DRAFT_1074334 [Suillus spraguei]|nr:hypothetical protein BDR07DRAFT_1074334 [Suillus spraguei]
MSSAVLDLIEIYDGEGAVIFIQRQMGGKPAFHVKTSADVKASQTSALPSNSVLVAINSLYENPFMIASTYPIPFGLPVCWIDPRRHGQIDCQRHQCGLCVCRIPRVGELFGYRSHEARNCPENSF